MTYFQRQNADYVGALLCLAAELTDQPSIARVMVAVYFHIPGEVFSA
jgi:hypothetical protein